MNLVGVASILKRLTLYRNIFPLLLFCLLNYFSFSAVKKEIDSQPSPPQEIKVELQNISPVIISDFTPEFSWRFSHPDNNDAELNFSEELVIDVHDVKAIKVVDLNNDGYKDIILCSGIQSYLCINNGDWTFTIIEKFGDKDTNSIDTCDIDNDGDLDVIVGNNGQNYLYRNEGNFEFTPDAQFGIATTKGIKAVDIDRDGDMDVVAVNFIEECLLFRNLGDGTFLTEHPFGFAYATSVEIGDMNNDGTDDVIIGNWFGTITIYQNDGNGFFPEKTYINVDDVRAITVTDIDNDGDLDIFAGRMGQDYLCRNDGNGNFSVENVLNGFNTFSVFSTDIDNDGDADIMEGTSEQNYIYRNDGNGVFEGIPSFSSAFTTSLYADDLDNDGDMDVVEGNLTNATIYKNNASLIKQGAYRILIASQSDNLNNDIGDIWDSGVVQSSFSGDGLTGISCGVELSPDRKYYYKIRVYDENNNEGEWSEIKEFTIPIIINSFILSDIATDSPAITHSQIVNVSEIDYFGDEPTEMMYSEDPSFKNTTWQFFRPTFTYRFSSHNGPKQLFLKLKNDYVDASMIQSASIILSTVDDAVIVNDTILEEMSPGQKYKVSVTVKNTGEAIWDGYPYLLGAVGDSDSLNGNSRQSLPYETYPGNEVIFEFYLIAPEQTGTYTTDWRMVKEWEHWFGESLVKEVLVVNGLVKNNSIAVAEYIPDTIPVNTKTCLGVTFKNTGNATWSEENKYRCGIVADYVNLGTQGRIFIDGEIYSGEERTFFWFVKPKEAGEYIIKVRMLQEYVAWFGDTIEKTVNVVELTGVDSEVFEIYE